MKWVDSIQQLSTWKKTGLILTGEFLFVFLFFFLLNRPSGQKIELLPLPTDEMLTVHVVGEVKNPGVYQVPPKARVEEAINLAGGMTTAAEPSSVNLAAFIVDGQQILVEGAHVTPNATLRSQRLGMLDINTATFEQLVELPGIGPDRANAILEYREEIGGFDTLQQLDDIPGIGEATLKQLSGLILVGP